MFPYYYKFERICIDAPKIKLPIKIANAISTFFSLLFVVCVLIIYMFYFVSTNMRTFEQTNVKLMLRNRYQIVKDKFNFVLTLESAILQDEHEQNKM